MNVGATELVIILVIVAVLLLPTILGAYRAFTSGHVGWGVGILAGWLVGFGWLIGIVYLLTHRRQQY